MQIQSPLIPASVRLTHLDWLRIIVVGMLVPFHSAMTFAPYGWYIRNAQLNLATQALVQVLDKYHMELLFFIAGVATWYSLDTRSWARYLLERLQRLVVPLVFAMLVIVPPCYYYSGLHFDRLFSITYSGFFDWYWKFWLQKSITPFHVLAGGTFRAGALWFLWYLVLYTFTLFPLILLIYKKARNTCLPKIAGFFEKPGAILLLVLPIMAAMVFVPWKVTMGDTKIRFIGWMITSDFQVLYYAIFFLYGFLFYNSESFRKGIDKTAPFVIPLAVITMTVFMLLVFPTWNKAPLKAFWYEFRGEAGTMGFYLSQCLYALTTWSWIISILYLARKFLSKATGFVKWGNDVVLPVYIVHSTFITLFSYYVVKWNMAVLPKYAIIVALSYIGSIAFVEIFKLSNVTRFLLGIRLKRDKGLPRT